MASLPTYRRKVCGRAECKHFAEFDPLQPIGTSRAIEPLVVGEREGEVPDKIIEQQERRPGSLQDRTRWNLKE